MAPDVKLPTYDYECENKHRFEVWQSMKDDPLKECPTCGSPVHRILHPAAIVFKGSGWYITDSRRGGSTDGEAKSATQADSDTKADAKSEPTAESKPDAKNGDASAKSGDATDKKSSKASDKSTSSASDS